MTREEAIKILEYPVKKWSMEWDEREDGLSYYEALDIAISALRHQDVADKDVGHNDPLTLDELRQMDGEPVWVCFIGDAIIREDGWFIVSEISASQIFIKGKVSLYKNLCYYGETWLAYRQKPEEGTA